MKKISQLIKELMKELKQPFIPSRFVFKKKNKAAALEKAWLSYLDTREDKTKESNQQRKLLYQFMHFHKENDLN